MTNESKIGQMLNNLKTLQSNPNFKLHKFDVFVHPESPTDKVVHEVYTTTSGGVYETFDEWYILSNGTQKYMSEIITDKTSMIEFISSLEPVKYELGGVIFN